ncbi:MAG: ABC transporter substrate-binding protein [Alphaproteobacteria bacterium]|nr:ABC transporter substrate-binding protein [Alphaproteobacteria bacterium]
MNHIVKRSVKAGVLTVLAWGLMTAGAAAQLAIVKAIPAVPQQIDLQQRYEGEASAYIGAEQASTLLQFDAAKLKGAGCLETPHVQRSLRPNLAESWAYSADGKALEFKLRKGVKSPAGNEMTATDVKWSLDRAIKLASIVRFLMFDINSFREDPIEIVDPLTVRVHLKAPTIFDFAVFTWNQIQIHDSKTVLANATAEDPLGNGWLAKNTADFGPWQITAANFTPGSRVTFTPNANYWNNAGRGNANRLVVLGVPDSSTRSQLLRTGEIDFAAALPLQEYANLTTDRNVKVETCVGATRDTLLLNYQDQRFANPLVRQAISLAIDRQALVRGVFRGFGKPAVTGVHADYGTEGLTPYIKFDLAKAKELMAQAGMANGFSAKFVVSASRPGAHAEQEAIFVADMLKQIGITLEIDIVASGTAFSERFFKGDYQAMLYSEGPAFADPFYSLSLMNHGKSFQNSFKFANERYDALVTEGLHLPAAASARRQEILVEVAKIMSENPPQVYLIDSVVPLARNPKVSGWEIQGPTAGNINAYLLRKGN